MANLSYPKHNKVVVKLYNGRKGKSAAIAVGREKDNGIQGKQLTLI